MAVLTGSQIRAARAMLAWGQERLAREASVSRPTIKRMEGLKGPGRSTAATLESVRSVLELAGIEFLPEDDRLGPGVRLRKTAARLVARRADAINRLINFQVMHNDREYDCTLRSSVLDALDGKVPGYATAADIEAAFDRHLALVLDRARKVVVEGLAQDGRLSLWPEDFPEIA